MRRVRTDGLVSLERLTAPDSGRWRCRHFDPALNVSYPVRRQAEYATQTWPLRLSDRVTGPPALPAVRGIRRENRSSATAESFERVHLSGGQRRDGPAASNRIGRSLMAALCTDLFKHSSWGQTGSQTGFRVRHCEPRALDGYEPFDPREGTLGCAHGAFAHALAGKRSMSVKGCVGEG